MRIKLGPADFAEGEMRGFEIGKKKNVVVAKLGEKYKALDDWCNHAGCLLSGGTLEGNTVTCPCHEVGFDLDTGKNMTSPGICDDQTRYDTDIEDGKLVVIDFPEV